MSDCGLSQKYSSLLKQAKISKSPIFSLDAWNGGSHLVAKGRASLRIKIGTTRMAE